MTEASTNLQRNSAVSYLQFSNYMSENFRTGIYSHFWGAASASLSFTARNSLHLKPDSFSSSKFTFSDPSSQSYFISKSVIEQRGKAPFLYSIQVRSCINKGQKGYVQKVHSEGRVDWEAKRSRSDAANSNFTCITNTALHSCVEVRAFKLQWIRFGGNENLNRRTTICTSLSASRINKKGNEASEILH